MGRRCMALARGLELEKVEDDGGEEEMTNASELDRLTIVASGGEFANEAVD